MEIHERSSKFENTERESVEHPSKIEEPNVIKRWKSQIKPKKGAIKLCARASRFRSQGPFGSVHTAARPSPTCTHAVGRSGSPADRKKRKDRGEDEERPTPKRGKAKEA